PPTPPQVPQAAAKTDSLPVLELAEPPAAPATTTPGASGISAHGNAVPVAGRVSQPAAAPVRPAEAVPTETDDGLIPLESPPVIAPPPPRFVAPPVARVHVDELDDDEDDDGSERIATFGNLYF